MIGDVLTKEFIIQDITKFGCGKLNHLPLDSMKKEDIMEHLEECKCPRLQFLKSKI